MARYLMMWEVDNSRIPIDLLERKNNWKSLLQEVTHDLEAGKLKDWSAFAGEGRGFCISEGSPAEVALLMQKFVPYVRFETHPLVSAPETLENVTKLGNG